MKHPFSLLLIALCFYSSLFANKDDISILRNRYIALFDEDQSSHQEIEKWFPLITETGQWSDINYADTKPTNWEPRTHWTRIRKLSELYYDKEEAYDPELLLQQIHSAIEYWLEANLSCSNGWYNAMGVPIEMASTLLLLEEQISIEQRDALIKLMNKPHFRGKIGVQDGVYYYGRNKPATGQNLGWLASIHIQMGIATGNEKWIQHAVTRLEEVLDISSYEGIQADYSFHQHGPQLYSGGYGLSFTETIGNLITILHGTSFSLSEQKEQVFVDFMLKGQAWMCRNQSLENQSKGREISRPKASARIIGEIAKKLSEANISQSEDLAKLANEVLYAAPLSKSGIKNFWRSDLLMQHTENFSISIAGTSLRLRGSEHLNGENDLGYYIPFGTHFIYRTPQDLDEIMPCYDFRRIPGSLNAENAHIPEKWSRNSYGTTSFVGGVTDGDIGCFAYHYDWENIEAKRAWFLTPQGIIALVANVESTVEEPLIQTLNQSRAKGKTLLKTDVGIEEVEGLKNRSAKAIFHNNIVYSFPKERIAKFGTEQRDGDWKKINKTRISKQIKENIFQLSFALTKDDKNSYSYRIYPHLSEEKFRKGIQSDWMILENNDSLQAIWNKETKKLQAIFYKQGSLKLPNGQKLTTRNPCNLILKYKEEHIELTVTDPTKSQEHLEVRLSGKILNSDKQARGFPLINLPQEQKRGSETTVQIPLRERPALNE